MEAAITTLLLNGVSQNALFAYGKPFFLFDTTKNQFANNSGVFQNPANMPGWSFTRASTGYAQTQSGLLLLFASGAPRITDKGLLIEGARTNLCLQSQTFDNASWTKSGATISADAATAPDGTLTADKLVEDTSTGIHCLIQTISKAASATQYAFSVLVQAAGRTDIRLTLDDVGSNNVGATFTLSGSGSTSSVSATGTFTGASATIVKIGSYYLCTLVGTSATETTLRLQYQLVSGGSVSYTGDGSSGAYFWGAQLEAAAFPSSYIPTTTASVTRAADVASIAVSGLGAIYTMFAEVDLPVVASGGQAYLGVSDGTGNNGSAIYNAGTSLVCLNKTGGANDAVVVPAGSISANVVSRLAGRFETNNINGRFNGGALGTLDTSCTVSARTQIELGTSLINAVPAFGYIRRAAIWPTAFSGANLQRVTT